jgi:hypothetical protein
MVRRLRGHGCVCVGGGGQGRGCSGPSTPPCESAPGTPTVRVPALPPVLPPRLRDTCCQPVQLPALPALSGSRAPVPRLAALLLQWASAGLLPAPSPAPRPAPCPPSKLTPMLYVVLPPMPAGTQGRVGEEPWGVCACSLHCGGAPSPRVDRPWPGQARGVRGGAAVPPACGRGAGRPPASSSAPHLVWWSCRRCPHTLSMRQAAHLASPGLPPACPGWDLDTVRRLQAGQGAGGEVRSDVRACAQNCHTLSGRQRWHRGQLPVPADMQCI